MDNRYLDNNKGDLSTSGNNVLYSGGRVAASTLVLYLLNLTSLSVRSSKHGACATELSSVQMSTDRALDYEVKPDPVTSQRLLD